jgi:hypothetical protein
MSEPPRPTAAAGGARAARQARLAEALRDNLRRRKEQARARAADRGASEEPGDLRERKDQNADPAA